VSDDGLDVVLCVVNLDPDGVQQDTIALDLEALGIVPGASFDVHDALSGTTYTWTGANPYVRLDPSVAPAHIFVVTP
jgi:starch synthase (maltosyl-transferring)